jgi:hypothetical protein
MFTDPERGRITVSLTAIIALVGLAIVVIGTHSLFPELLFYSIVVILIAVIVILLGEAFFWTRISRYVNGRSRRRKQNISARRYFVDFKDFVDRFTSLREFSGGSQGIIGILNELAETGTKESLLTRNLANKFSVIMQNPLNDLKQRLNNLCFSKSEVNGEFLSSLAKEFENYIALHKQLYVDLAVAAAREMGLQRVADSTKRAYREYKEDYNQFIIAYSEFAKKASKERIGFFSQYLQKASEL